MGEIVNIEVKAWWLLVIPLLLIFIHFIIALIMKDMTNEKYIEKEKEKKKTLTSWIEKKDILYWLLIICLAAISIFTFQYSGDKDVISHWGFAGTIVSIILAVVAIGFTLYQSLSSEFSSSKIVESAEIISKVSEELNNSDLAKAGEVINKAATDMSKYHSELEEKIISRVINEIGDLRNDHEKKFQGLFNTVNDYYSDRIKINNNSKSTVIQIDDFIENMLEGFSRSTTVYSYAVLYLEYKGVSINDKDFKYIEFFENLGYSMNSNDNDKDTDGAFENGVEVGMSITNYLRTKEWFTKLGILDGFMELDNERKKEALLKIEKIKPNINKSTKFIKSFFN
ncbi:hypothetical protein [Lysinibacillus capsici]|uniref:hypothetical protein n=1 Tax=Lysinibacillus capsici TaxID=2115968 RepID=UPI003BAC9E46